MKPREYFKKIYHSIIVKLNRDLHLNDVRHSQTAILAKLEELASLQESLKNLIVQTNILAGGAYSLGEQIIPNQGAVETQELIQIFTHDISHLDFDIVEWVTTLEDKYLDSNSTLLIGPNSSACLHSLQNKKVSSLTHIIITPPPQSDTTKKSIYIAPSHLDSFLPPVHDTLVIPDPTISSLLLKHNLFRLANKTKKFAIVRVRVNPQTISSKTYKQPFRQVDNQIIYNDNFVRSMLHSSGFTEVIATYNKQKKISKFNYKKGLTVTSKLPKRSKTKSIAFITYYAHKLPSR